MMVISWITTMGVHCVIYFISKRVIHLPVHQKLFYFTQPKFWHLCMMLVFVAIMVIHIFCITFDEEIYFCYNFRVLSLHGTFTVFVSL